MPTAAPATAATLSTVRESSGSRSTRRRTTSRTLAGTVAAATPSCRPRSADSSRTSSVRKKGLPAVRPWSASAAAGSRSRSPTSRAKDRTCSGPSPVSSTRRRSGRRASEPRVDATTGSPTSSGRKVASTATEPVLQLGGEVVEQPQGVGVGPVDVLEDDDDRLEARPRGEEPGDRVVQLQAVDRRAEIGARPAREQLERGVGDTGRHHPVHDLAPRPQRSVARLLLAAAPHDLHT